jgi:hypothetical protein
VSEARFRSDTRFLAGAADDPPGSKKNFKTLKGVDLEAAVEPVPSHIDWSQQGFVSQARDQADSGSCVSHAACAAAEARRLVANLAPVTLAPRSLHLCLIGLDFQQAASRARLLETVQTKGLPVDSGSDSLMFERAHCPADGQIARLPLTQFFDFPDSISAKRELASNGPIVAHMMAHEDFFRQYVGTFDVYRADPLSSSLGKHAVCIVGYDNFSACWIGLNSLGQQWGNQGLFRIAYDDAASALLTGAHPAYSLDCG